MARFFAFFYALSFERNFFFDRRCPLKEVREYGIYFPVSNDFNKEELLLPSRN